MQRTLRLPASQAMFHGRACSAPTTATTGLCVGAAQPRPRKPDASNPSAGCDVWRRFTVALAALLQRQQHLGFRRSGAAAIAKPARATNTSSGRRDRPPRGRACSAPTTATTPGLFVGAAQPRPRNRRVRRTHPAGVATGHPAVALAALLQRQQHPGFRRSGAAATTKPARATNTSRGVATGHPAAALPALLQRQGRNGDRKPAARALSWREPRARSCCSPPPAGSIRRAGRRTPSRRGCR